MCSMGSLSLGRENGKLWTNKRTEFTVYTAIFFSRNDLRKVIALLVGFCRFDENLLGTKANTKATTFTPFGN